MLLLTKVDEQLSVPNDKRKFLTAIKRVDWDDVCSFFFPSECLIYVRTLYRLPSMATQQESVKTILR